MAIVIIVSLLSENTLSTEMTGCIMAPCSPPAQPPLGAQSKSRNHPVSFSTDYFRFLKPPLSRCLRLILPIEHLKLSQAVTVLVRPGEPQGGRRGSTRTACKKDTFNTNSPWMDAYKDSQHGYTKKFNVGCQR
jgi:hypothetical protein